MIWSRLPRIWRRRGHERMKWSCLQHVAFETPGHLAAWAKNRGYDLTQVELWNGAALPRAKEADGLFILGGPMNVYEDDRHPWLVPEKRLIEEAISAGKPILGICLGAQLLSVVLGGSVAANPWKEIGWFPIQMTPAGRDAGPFRDFPPKFMAFHWHGDCFAIPPGSIHVARSDGCENQAFTYGDRVVGLQFHLECTETSIEALIAHCGQEATCGPYGQDAPAIRGQIGRLTQSHALLEIVLDHLVRDAP